MKKKVLSAVLCAAMTASALAGCGSSAASSGGSAAAGDTEAVTTEAATETAEVSTFGSDSGTKLNLWTFVGAHANFYGKMVDQWNTANPDKQIQLTATTYPYADMHNKLLMSLQAGTGAPDICDVEVGQFPNVVKGEDKWLYPLDDAASQYLPDMVPARMEIYQGEDKHYYGVDFHVGATVMYYNLAELEKYGITQADVDAVVTWDDYTKLGEKYKAAVKDDSKYWTSVDTGGTDWLWLSMAEYGEDWTGGSTGKANVELPSVKKMLNMQVDWLSKGIAEVSPDGHVDLEAGFQNILDHNIVSFPKAMWYMSRFINYMPEEKGNWYIAKCPVYEAGQTQSVGIGGTGTVVTQQSKDKELAAEFLCWAKMSKEGETAIWNDLGFDVCNMSLWSDDSFAHDESNQCNTFFRNKPYDVLNTLAGKIGKISVTSISPTINEQICTTTLNDVLENGVSVDDALKDAQDAISLEE